MTSQLFDLELEHRRGACILGAGSAGLSCAYVLKRNGMDVTVLEKEDTVGGDAQTLQVEDFRFDLGDHALRSSDPVVRAFFCSVLGEDLRRIPCNTQTLYKRTLITSPTHLGSVTRKVNPFLAVWILTSYGRARLLHRPPQQAETLHDWHCRRFGKRLSQSFLMPYCEKVWGDPCHLVSPDFDCQAIREPASAVGHFLYPRLGIGGFSQRLGEGVGRKRILTGSKVTRIGVEAGRISFVECGNPPFKHRVTAQEYLSSIPLPRLVPLIDPPAPAAVQQAAHVLENRNLVTVNLLIDRPSFNDASWIHVQEPRVRTARIIEPRNLSPEMAPEGKTSLVVEFACGGGDDIWSAPPDRNLGMAEHELTSKLELVGRDEILSGHVRRWQDAYPACNLGYQEHRQTVLDYLSTIANLRLIGRNGRHRYGDLGHSIEMGLKAALNVMGEDFDLEAVNAPPSDPERYPYFPALDQEWVNSQSTLVPSLRDKEDMAAAMAAK